MYTAFSTPCFDVMGVEPNLPVRVKRDSGHEGLVALVRHTAPDAISCCACTNHVGSTFQFTSMPRTERLYFQTGLR